jgi:hypothetical protein
MTTFINGGIKSDEALNTNTKVIVQPVRYHWRYSFFELWNKSIYHSFFELFGKSSYHSFFEL